MPYCMQPVAIVTSDDHDIEKKMTMMTMIYLDVEWGFECQGISRT